MPASTRPDHPNLSSPTVTIYCSQVRVQQYMKQNCQNEPSPPTTAFSPYQIPPKVQPKEGYISPSESDEELECSNNYNCEPAAKIFSRGQFLFHKTYTGLEPFGFVDTGCTRRPLLLVQGAQLGRPQQACRLDYVLCRHNIPRWRSRKSIKICWHCAWPVPSGADTRSAALQRRIHTTG
jgi:hypothetical protein